MAKIAAALLLFSLTTSPLLASDLLFIDAEADCAAEIIFMNECAGKDDNLLYWSPNEDFPSLGIGHFIWYPSHNIGPYLESFPEFLDFAVDYGMTIPEWLMELPDRHCPWPSREAFMQDRDSDRAKELRVFLRSSKREQAHFIIQRFLRVFPTILEDHSEAERQKAQVSYDLLRTTREGIFAMIDYVNFKGEGLRADARYQGVGWGLAQVLVEMKMPDDPNHALLEFVEAAERVLERRVEHAPRPEVESKWLPGWKNRLRKYLKITC